MWRWPRRRRTGSGPARPRSVTRETARTRAAGITPETDTPEGVTLLVTSMDERLAAMQQHIAAVREQMRANAERIREQAVELAAVRASS